MNLWVIRDYIYLLSAQASSTLVGAGMNVIFPLLILHFTKSIAAAGLVGVLRSGPYLFLSLPLGALVDRWNRRHIMIACQTVRYVCFLGLGLMAYGGIVNEWHIYAVCLIDGILFVFFNIAEAAALSSVVPCELLSNASSTNEAGFGAAMALGPAAATLAYQLWDVSGVLLAGAACYLMSFVFLKLIKTELNMSRSAMKQSLLVEISEGVRWLFGSHLVLLLACIMGGLNLINAAMPLLAITLGQQLGSSDTSIGAMVACGGIGSILGSLCGIWWLKLQGFGRGVVLALWLHAAALVGFFLVRNLLFLGIIYGLVIAFYSLYAVMQFAYRVKSVPERLQGRVNSACRLIAFSLYPLGSAMAGLLSEYLGSTAAIAFFVSAAVILAVVLSLSRSVVFAWREGLVLR